MRDNGMMQMPQYFCIKKIRALRIKKILIENDGSAILIPIEKGFAPFQVDADYIAKHTPQAGGYYIEYVDGYKSFSPASMMFKVQNKKDGSTLTLEEYITLLPEEHSVIREYKRLENKVVFLKMKLDDTKRPFWKKKYPALSFQENFLNGHIDFFNITLYGENAMHWGVNIKTRLGYICFRLPFRCFGKWWPLYLYISPNGTPAASTFYRGGDDPSQKKKAAKRRKNYGWNYNIKLLTKEDR